MAIAMVGVAVYRGRDCGTAVSVRSIRAVCPWAGDVVRARDDWMRDRHAVEIAATWFWITIGVITVLHVPLILFVPWTAKWVSAFVIVPLALADLYAMLTIIAVVGSYVDGPP